MRLFRKIKEKYKKFACWIGWHSPPSKWEAVETKFGTTHCKCPWCGYEGMVDSQGNLF